MYLLNIQFKKNFSFLDFAISEILNIRVGVNVRPLILKGWTLLEIIRGQNALSHDVRVKGFPSFVYFNISEHVVLGFVYPLGFYVIDEF